MTKEKRPDSPFQTTQTGAPPATSFKTPIRTPQSQAAHWSVPEETPVAFVYNRRNYAVMLATPDNLQDFAIGFSLTERVIDAPEDIEAVDIAHNDKGVDLRITISPEKLERLDIRQQRRNLVGRSGCGVCGLENADSFFETLPCIAETPTLIPAPALKRALEEFQPRQPLNQQTKTVHGAAWASRDGAIRCVREDVGRHNALDKLLGARVADGRHMTDGFVMMSSRCSYEIVEKSARLGVQAIACLSGPTAFAIRKAKEANITLYCRSDNGFVEVG